jgi:DNA-binding transcriptional LysR family regulator
MRWFIRICDLHNFTKAAHDLYITQPTLSRRIIALEDEIKVRLLERSKTGVNITEGGKVFYDEAKKLVGAHTELLEKMKKFRSGYLGKVVIGCYSPKLMGPLLFATQLMEETYPGIEMDFQEMSQVEVRNSYINGKLDIVYGYRDGLLKTDESIMETIAKNNIVALIPKSHRLWDASSVTSADLIGERFALIKRGLRLSEISLQAFENKGLSFKDAIECESSTARLFKIASGKYIGISGKYASENLEDFSRHIRLIPITDVELDIADLCVIYRPSNGSAERFVSCMMKFAETADAFAN